MAKQRNIEMILNSDGVYVKMPETSSEPMSRRPRTVVEKLFNPKTATIVGGLLALDYIMVPSFTNGKSVHESVGIPVNLELAAYGSLALIYGVLLIQSFRKIKQTYFG